MPSSSLTERLKELQEALDATIENKMHLDYSKSVPKDTAMLDLNVLRDLVHAIRGVLQ